MAKQRALKDKSAPEKAPAAEEHRGITRITVSGFKSIRDEQSIEIRPLTILAGANSSGKSSIMQPLLLMKQTLEANYDPGPLLLDGPNVKFSSVDQLFTGKTRKMSGRSFSVGIECESAAAITTVFGEVDEAPGLQISEMISRPLPDGVALELRPDSVKGEIRVEDLSSWGLNYYARLFGTQKVATSVTRKRCFLQLMCRLPEESKDNISVQAVFPLPSDFLIHPNILQVIHLPGLRGNPERVYSRSGTGPTFPGTFSPYVASLLMEWQTKGDNKIQALEKGLVQLQLTSKVQVRHVSDTHLELHVARLKSGQPNFRRNLVSIADVGVGVSQALPVVVALLAAGSGRLVYVEQPEIHLHPRAQMGMAEVLADAAKRGVRVVAETHSSLLLLAIQTLVAQGKLPPELVKLHWFKLNKKGFTEITSTDLDEAGRFDSDWPEDFGEVELNAERGYLEASEKLLTVD